MRHQSWKLDIRLICRSQEDRRPRSLSGSSTAEIAILTFLHVGGKICPNPARTRPSASISTEKLSRRCVRTARLKKHYRSTRWCNAPCQPWHLWSRWEHRICKLRPRSHSCKNDPFLQHHTRLARAPRQKRPAASHPKPPRPMPVRTREAGRRGFLFGKGTCGREINVQQRRIRGRRHRSHEPRRHVTA